MRLSDRAYTRLKRLQILTGVVPVGIFLLSHLATNARVVGGPEAFDRAAVAINRTPYLTLIEIVAVAAPMVLHVGLGVLLGLTPQAAGDTRGYPSLRMLTLQRVTGFWLLVYVLFHVFATRLSPDRAPGGEDLFALMAEQLAHPGLFAFHAGGVLAAAYHFGNGLVALAGPWGLNAGPRSRTIAARAGAAAFVVLSLAGLHALLGFVHPAFRWLAP